MEQVFSALITVTEHTSCHFHGTHCSNVCGNCQLTWFNNNILISLGLILCIAFLRSAIIFRISSLEQFEISSISFSFLYGDF